jgi:hypothetical protein
MVLEPTSRPRTLGFNPGAASECIGGLYVFRRSTGEDARASTSIVKFFAEAQLKPGFAEL